MLKSKDFAQIGKGIKSFVFGELTPLPSACSSYPLYCDDRGNRYLKLTYDSLKEIQIIDTLSRSGLILNYKGALYRDTLFYAFVSHNEFMSLYQFAQKYMCREERVDEIFCTELIETCLWLFQELEKMGEHLRILTPTVIGVRNFNGHNNYGMGLLLPLPSVSFYCLFREEFENNLSFAAPEIIKYFEQNKDFPGCQKEFRKACLYSLGMVVLSAFGYTFSSRERISALKNGKEFKLTFKQIRKEIKLLHGSKFIPKVLKLLLEECEKSRDLLQTFQIKIKSQQFRSLRKNKDSLSGPDIKVTTRYTQGDGFKTDYVDKSQKTISIAIGSRSSPMTISQKSETWHSELPDSPINIEVSEENQTPLEAIKGELRELPEEEDMRNSFKKSLKRPLHNAQALDGLGESRKESRELDDNFIKYDIEELKFEREEQHGNAQNQSMVSIEAEVVLAEDEQLQRDSAIRKQLKGESRLFMLFFIVCVFLYGVARMMRESE